jgi:PAS domain S-box-containing protein
VTLEELRASEDELKESARELASAREVVEEERRRYRELFEFAPDGYLVTCEKGSIREANRAAGELLGLPPEFLIGKPLTFCIEPERRAAFEAELRAARQSDSVRLLETTLLPYRRPPVVAELRVGPVRGSMNRVIGFRWLIRDVTARNETERRVRASGEQLRALWARLESIREEEQRRIARELHDEFGQAITALRFDLNAIAPAVRRTEEGPAFLERIFHQLDQMLAAVRRISRELRPSMLDELGLEAAAEWHTKEFAARTDIECSFASTLPDAPLDPVIASTAFRILQEALTNVGRHSGARHVKVCLGADDERLSLTITDDGSGISSDRISGAAGLGLVGMRERARLLDGTLRIERVPEGGTRVSLSLPRRRSA